MWMIVHPDHTSEEVLRGLFLALPPKMGESLESWSERTETEFQGDCKSLILESLPQGMTLRHGKFVEDTLNATDRRWLEAVWIHLT